MDLWLGLESYLQESSADTGRRLVVFTGPIFGDTDPVYRGVQIPLKFFKVSAVMHQGSLAGSVPNIPGTHQRHRGTDRARPGSTDRRGPDAHRLNPAHRLGRFDLAAP